MRAPYPGPLKDAEERSASRGIAKLSEHRDVRVVWRPDLREHRRGLCAQGCAQSGFAGGPFLWLLSFGQAKESDPAAEGGRKL